MTMLPTGARYMAAPLSRFHVMAKPVGAACNLACQYCFYSHYSVTPGPAGKGRMTDEMLDRFVRQYIEGQDHHEVVFSWQGGEPTLAGLDFFRKVVSLQTKYGNGKRIENDLQTNGLLLDDEWGEFLREHRFLVGLSVDGPQGLHDRYRTNHAGQSTLKAVVAAAALLQRHGVSFNTLTVVHRENARRPNDVYRFLRDELGASRMQFIPCVEPRQFQRVAPGHWHPLETPMLGSANAKPGCPESFVTDWSVDSDDWGYFLIRVFDEWYRHDIGKVFVYLFESALGQWMGQEASVCTLASICGKATIIEADGSIFSCDHFVYPEYRLGSIESEHLADLVLSSRQATFGCSKEDRLTEHCRQCPFLFACHGECPRTRFLQSPTGEQGVSYLCSGMRRYFAHIEPFMRSLMKRLG